MFESIAAFWAEYGNVLTDGVWDTLVMVVISTAFAYLIGLPLGVALILTQPHGIRPHRGVYRVLDWIVNIGRSVPFIRYSSSSIPIFSGNTDIHSRISRSLAPPDDSRVWMARLVLADFSRVKPFFRIRLIISRRKKAFPSVVL